MKNPTLRGKDIAEQVGYSIGAIYKVYRQSRNAIAPRAQYRDRMRIALHKRIVQICGENGEVSAVAAKELNVSEDYIRSIMAKWYKDHSYYD